jgi:hypothetical protein
VGAICVIRSPSLTILGTTAIGLVGLAAGFYLRGCRAPSGSFEREMDWLLALTALGLFELAAFAVFSVFMMVAC